jgi:glucose uptake protein GlcU
LERTLPGRERLGGPLRRFHRRGHLLSSIVARPPLSGGAATLEFIAENRTVYPLEQILWMWPNVFAMIVFLTLYVALKHLNRNYAALGALIGGAGWALGMANPTTNFGAAALVYLSDQYAAATTDAQHAAFRRQRRL